LCRLNLGYPRFTAFLVFERSPQSQEGSDDLGFFLAVERLHDVEDERVSLSLHGRDGDG
jgi:hypothetical protein